jgi:hypothetical protein
LYFAASEEVASLPAWKTLEAHCERRGAGEIRGDSHGRS